MNRTFWPVLGLLCIAMTFPAYAGDINGNEQEIVSVINSQFEKDGIIYRVKQEYIDSAMNYLRQDDIDLMPEDVQMVIGEIYANVQTGVESGYLVEVGRVEAGGAAGTPAGETGNHTSGAAETPEGVTKTDGEAEGNEGAGPDEESADGEKPEAGTDEAPAANDEPEPEPVAQAISILELMDSMPGQNYDYIASDTDKLLESLVIPYKTMWYAMLGLAILLTAGGLLCLWEKCFAAHHHRRLRSMLKQALGAELFCLVFAMETLLGIGVGAFHDSAVLNRLNQTEYYRTIYEELRHDTRISFALMDIPDKVMDDAITYERVVMAARQQVDSTLHKGSYQANTAILTERLEKDIRSYLEDSSIELTDKAETGLDLLMKRLDEKYTQLLKWPFAPWWVQLADRFVPFMKKAGAGLLIMTVAVHLLLFWIHHYVHRAMRTCGRRILAASGAAMLLGAIPYMGNLVVRHEMIPEYMSQFFYGYERGILLAVMMIGAAGILVGIGYLLMARSWKEGKQQQ
ncbi:MAG: hypothetical protein KHZ58_18965 [Hungatella hathewayi]|nr:hypothetical protein [Hungatella hathewayi]